MIRASYRKSELLNFVKVQRQKYVLNDNMIGYIL